MLGYSITIGPMLGMPPTFSIFPRLILPITPVANNLSTILHYKMVTLQSHVEIFFSPTSRKKTNRHSDPMCQEMVKISGQNSKLPLALCHSEELTMCASFKSVGILTQTVQVKKLPGHTFSGKDEGNTGVTSLFEPHKPMLHRVPILKRTTPCFRHNRS